MVTQDMHKNKLLQLSEEQAKPLFNIMDSVKIIDVHVPIPDYVMQTLALGPKNPTLDKFDPNRILAEIDSVLEFCESRVPDPEMKNEMESGTISYNKKAKEKLQEEVKKLALCSL